MFFGQIKAIREILNKRLKSRQSISDYWKNEFIKNPYFDDVYITVDMTLGNGKSIRIATNSCTVTLDNSDIVYMPFLMEEPVIQSSYDLRSGDGNERSVPLNIDGRVIGAASIVSSGTFLTGFAEISLQKNNGKFENRLVLMRGTIGGGIVFGTKDEIVTLSIVDSKISNDLIIPQYLILKDPDFPDLPKDQDGKRFPIVLGKYQGGVPCIRITANDYGPMYLIAYGHNIRVNSVRINERDILFSDPERGWETKTSVTPSGIPYTYLDFVYPNSLQHDNNPNSNEEGTYEYKWTEGNVSVYADVTNSTFRFSDNILDQMKELIVNFSGYGIESFDEEIFSRSKSRCPSLNIQTLINASDSNNLTTVIQYVQNTFTDQFPMFSLLYSRVGIGIVFTDRRSKSIFESFIVGQSGIMDRVSSVEETPSEEIYNSFLIKYSYNTADDSYNKQLRIDHTNNELCSISYYKLGKREYDVIESVSIYDDLTASYVMNWLASHLSLPRYKIEYSCNPSLFLSLRVGDNIKITDNELGWTNVDATITNINYNKNNLNIKVDVWIIYNKIENISGN